MRHGVTGLAALIFMALALPPLLARLTGGHPPGPVPQLAALAPAAVVPATVAVIIAAATARWLAVLFAIPAVILLIWQLPPRRRISYQAPAGPSRESGSALTRSGCACSPSMPRAVQPTRRRSFALCGRTTWMC